MSISISIFISLYTFKGYPQNIHHRFLLQPLLQNDFITPKSLSSIRPIQGSFGYGQGGIAFATEGLRWECVWAGGILCVFVNVG